MNATLKNATGIVAIGLLSLSQTHAQNNSTGWHARNFPEAVWHTAVFAMLGVILAIIGYKLFDLATPGKLHHEILQNKNVAAAIVGAAIVLGVCILVAAAMVG